MKSPHLDLAKNYWKNHLQPGDLSIDATCGNGHDTLFLSEFGPVIALDIQEAAIEATKKRAPLATCYQMCHSQIATLNLSAKLIVFNLGYLPGGDKSITTEKATSLQAIEKSLTLLTFDGALSIMCYPGHLEGEKEERVLLDEIGKLSSTKWLVCHHRWINRPKAPSFLWVKRVVI